MATAKKRSLGRGLGALLSDSGQEMLENQIQNKVSSESDIIHIDINKITPNRKQPRKNFDEESLNELAESIKIHGILQPIIVKTIDNGYEIIAGERRWRASRLAEQKTMPCIIRSYSDQDNLMVALIENLQREQLNPMDESSAYYYMMENFGMTQEELSKNVGKSRPYIANAVRLQKLSEPVRKMLSDGTITAGHGRALLAVENSQTQFKLANEIVNKKLSVREIEEIIKNLNEASRKVAPVRPASRFADIESDIKDSIGAKVRIKEKNDKGTIQLSFYSRDELDRLIELLLSFR